MDWVILGVLVLAFVSISRRLTLLEQRVRVNNELILSNRPRQFSNSPRKVHQASPGVDSRGRTTRRDTNDLPATGRQSKMTKRVVMRDE